jgi:hypothetical protein
MIIKIYNLISLFVILNYNVFRYNIMSDLFEICNSNIKNIPSDDVYKNHLMISCFLTT